MTPDVPIIFVKLELMHRSLSLRTCSQVRHLPFSSLRFQLVSLDEDYLFKEIGLNIDNERANRKALLFLSREVHL